MSKPHRHVKEKDHQWDKDYLTYEELKVSACHQCIEQGGNVEDAKLWMGFLHLQWVQSRMCIKEISYSEDAICSEIEMDNASAEELLVCLKNFEDIIKGTTN
ncbi:hypothetical protein DPMN_081653 [Dreissena polymorpha]|uniref:Uncharacterized protein n=1 Tax=Dreissena polymorpha TaxID=45954 RepID=A0A9D3Y5F3_DREPO|nr:hypothetical protein DPMN_081653 [Dreissena polymorpha]